MQGNRVEEGVIAALNRIAESIDCWDVVVIIRGGGATSELSCFDTYDLANNCAQFPLPIITGIGHQRDESVLDIVAHTRAKTPTAAAELLIHAMLEQDDMIASMMQGVVDGVRLQMDNEWLRLQGALSRLPMATALYLQGEKARLQSSLQGVLSSARLLVGEHMRRLDVCKAALDAASPERVLAMGYSITRVNGKVVRSLDDVAVGDRVSTSVAGGEFTSIVEDKQN